MSGRPTASRSPAYQKARRRLALMSLAGWALLVAASVAEHGVG